MILTFLFQALPIEVTNWFDLNFRLNFLFSFSLPRSPIPHLSFSYFWFISFLFCFCFVRTKTIKNRKINTFHFMHINKFTEWGNSNGIFFFSLFLSFHKMLNIVLWNDLNNIYEWEEHKKYAKFRQTYWEICILRWKKRRKIDYNWFSIHSKSYNFFSLFTCLSSLFENIIFSGSE